MIKHRSTLALLFGLALVFSAANHASAQPRTNPTGPETDDEYKVTTYKRFVENREPNPGAAYQAAKDYMARYGKEDDKYTSYLKQWISAFEKDDRQDNLLRAIYGEKNYAAGFGLAKQVLADDPEDVKALIALGYGGYLATTNAKTKLSMPTRCVMLRRRSNCSRAAKHRTAGIHSRVAKTQSRH